MIMKMLELQLPEHTAVAGGKISRIELSAWLSKHMMKNDTSLFTRKALTIDNRGH